METMRIQEDGVTFQIADGSLHSAASLQWCVMFVNTIVQ